MGVLVLCQFKTPENTSVTLYQTTDMLVDPYTPQIQYAYKGTDW